MKKRIRLAILGTQGIPAKYGGYETFAEELATRLMDMGTFEVTVYCPRTEDPAPLPSFRGVALRYVQAPGRGGLANILFDFWCLFACLGKHDIVYMCGYGASYLCFLPRLFGARVYINLGGLEWKRSKWPAPVRAYVKICEWFCGQFANRVICDAQAILDYYREAYYCPADLNFVAYGTPTLPLGTDSVGLLPPGLTPLDYYLVVSRLEPENNVLEMIQGYLLSPSSKPLVIVGNLDTRPYVKELQRAANNRVIFLGGVYDKPRLAALRRHAFVAFHGHSVGGTNPSLLEALAAGRPILAHDNPFNREVGGKLLHFFRTPEDIPGVLHYYEKEAMHSDLDQLPAATRWLNANYSWDQIALTYAELFRMDAAQLGA